jgi:hypothetical protein
MGPCSGGHGGIEELQNLDASALHYHRELVGRAPTLRILLGGWHHFPLQPPSLTPFVEGDYVDPQHD